MIYSPVTLFKRNIVAEYASSKKTGFIPLRRINSVAVVLYVDSPYFEQCKETVADFFAQRAVKFEFYCLDLRRPGKKTNLMPPAWNTFLRKELNWYGRPDPVRLEGLSEHPVDLLISLVGKKCFVNEIICAAIPASFKIGSRKFDSHPFNMISTAHNEVANFRNIIEMLGKISD